MKMSLTVDDKKAKKMIEGVIKGIKDPTPALKQIEKYQFKQIDEAFKTAGKNIAGTWKKLSPNYLKSKIRSGFLTPILVRTGDMRKSNVRKKLNRKGLEIKNKKDYFKDHQVGGKLPRRQVYGHSKAMIKKALKIFQDYLIKLAKNG